jgi:hypothetical protein
MLDRGYADFRENPSVLKNSLDARFRPRSGTKTPVLGRFEPDLWSLLAQSRLFQQAGGFSEVLPSQHPRKQGSAFSFTLVEPRG